VPLHVWSWEILCELLRSLR